MMTVSMCVQTDVLTGGAAFASGGFDGGGGGFGGLSAQLGRGGAGGSGTVPGSRGIALGGGPATGSSSSLENMGRSASEAGELDDMEVGGFGSGDFGSSAAAAGAATGDGWEPIDGEGASPGVRNVAYTRGFIIHHFTAS